MPPKHKVPNRMQYFFLQDFPQIPKGFAHHFLKKTQSAESWHMHIKRTICQNTSLGKTQISEKSQRKWGNCKFYCIKHRHEYSEISFN